MENMNQLIHQRGQIQARVIVIIEKLNEAAENPEMVSPSLLKAFEKHLEVHYAEFLAKHDLIMDQCSSTQFEEQDREYEEFDELHTDALVKLNQLTDMSCEEQRNSPQEIVRHRGRVFERSEVNRAPSSRPPTMAETSSPPTVSHPATASPAEKVCKICAVQHTTYKCPSFLRMSVDQRASEVKMSGLCFGCLRKGHQVRACPSKESCSRCSGRHHSMLHFERLDQLETCQSSSSVISEQPEEKTAVESDVPEEAESAGCSGVQHRSHHVFLMPALMNAGTKSEGANMLLALLDTKSRIGMVSESAVRLLGLPRCPAVLPVVGVRGVRCRIRQIVKTKFKRDCEVTTRMTRGTLSISVTIWKWKIPIGIVLVDPRYIEPRNVTLLIDGEPFFSILRRAQLRISEKQPAVYGTQFEGVVAGVLEESGEDIVHVMRSTSESPLQEILQRFSKRRQFPETKMLVSEGQDIEAYFCRTYRREVNERVGFIPQFHDFVSEVGDPKSLTIQRFVSSEADQANESKMRESCQAFVKVVENVNNVVRRPNNFPSRVVVEPAGASADVVDSDLKAREESVKEILVIELRGNSDRKRGNLVQRRDSGGEARMSGVSWSLGCDRVLFGRSTKVNQSCRRVMKPSIQQLMRNELRWSENVKIELLQQSLVQLCKIETWLWTNSEVELLWMRKSLDPLLDRGCSLAEAGAAGLVGEEYYGGLLICFDACWSDHSYFQAVNYELQCVAGSMFGDLEKCNYTRRTFEQSAWDMRELSKVNYLYLWAKWTIDYFPSLHSRAFWTISAKTGTIVLQMRDRLMDELRRWVLNVALYLRRYLIRTADTEVLVVILASPSPKIEPLPLADTNEIAISALESYSNRREYVRAVRVQCK